MLFFLCIPRAEKYSDRGNSKLEKIITKKLRSARKFAPIHHTRTSKDRPTEWFARHDWITNIDNNREWIYIL